MQACAWSWGPEITSHHLRNKIKHAAGKCLASWDNSLNFNSQFCYLLMMKVRFYIENKINGTFYNKILYVFVLISFTCWNTNQPSWTKYVLQRPVPPKHLHYIITILNFWSFGSSCPRIIIAHLFLGGKKWQNCGSARKPLDPHWSAAMYKLHTDLLQCINATDAPGTSTPGLSYVSHFKHCGTTCKAKTHVYILFAHIIFLSKSLFYWVSACHVTTTTFSNTTLYYPF